MAENNPSDTPNFIELAGDITIAWLQNPNVHPGSEDVPAFLQKMHAAIAGLDAAPVTEAVEVTYEPAVSVRSSVKPDHLVSLIDGKAYKTLKRHLAGHGLTPDEYRARYGLKADYPMVAESYAAQRRDIAKNLGLGLGRKRAALAGADAAVEDAPVSSAPDAIATEKTAPTKASAKSKRTLRKPKNETAVAAPDAPEVPEAVAGVPVAPAVQVKAKRAARPARKAVTVALAEAEASAPAAVPTVPVTSKPRRMARAPQKQPEAAKAASKPKRAAAPKKAADKPKSVPKGKGADAPPKKPRGKKAAAVGVDAVSLEG